MRMANLSARTQKLTCTVSCRQISPSMSKHSKVPVRQRRCSSLPQSSLLPGPKKTDTDAEKAEPVGGKATSRVKAIRAQLRTALDRKLELLAKEIMPRERGDARDWALMWTSVAVFVYMAMHMYRLYAYAYHAMGFRPIMQVLGQ